MRGHFRVMVPGHPGGMPGHFTVGQFRADTEEKLVAELARRLPTWKRDESLVPVDEHALTMLLRASLRREVR